MSVRNAAPSSDNDGYVRMDYEGYVFTIDTRAPVIPGVVRIEKNGREVWPVDVPADIRKRISEVLVGMKNAA